MEIFTRTLKKIIANKVQPNTLKITQSICLLFRRRYVKSEAHLGVSPCRFYVARDFKWLKNKLKPRNFDHNEYAIQLGRTFISCKYDRHYNCLYIQLCGKVSFNS